MSAPASPIAAARPLAGAALPILFALSASHLINDLIQSLLPSIYPLLKERLSLSFGQVGAIQFVFLITASILQPLVGISTDRKAQPFSLAVGMGCSLAGLLLLSTAGAYALVLLAASIIGMGSSIFHPEASRVARAASGGRYGFAQSVFQVGGNSGQAIGPLLAALIIAPLGQGAVAWFAVVALLGLALLTWVGRWYSAHLGAARKAAAPPPPLSGAQKRAIAILLALVFSKNFYMSSFHSFYTFYLIQRFGLTIADSQIWLFVFLAAVAAGTLAGGPIGDRFGRSFILWTSVLGVLPFTLALPWAGFVTTVALTVVIGFVMGCSFPAIVVYAQEIAPGRVGTIGGLFFGLSFGMAGLGAASFGLLADAAGLDMVYRVSSFLPAIGLLLWFMPDRERLATP